MCLKKNIESHIIVRIQLLHLKWRGKEFVFTSIYKDNNIKMVRKTMVRCVTSSKSSGSQEGTGWRG